MNTGIFSSEAAAAAEAAAATQRAAAMAAIRNQVSALNNKIERARDCIRQVRSAGSALEAGVNGWKTACSRSMDSEMVSKISVGRKFMGPAARGIRSDFPPRTEQMNRTGTAAAKAVSLAGEQVRRLEAYIDRLEAEKATLLGRLSQM